MNDKMRQAMEQKMADVENEWRVRNTQWNMTLDEQQAKADAEW